MIYLDTHVVVWLYSDLTGLFPQKVLTAIEGNDLLISPMVHLELHYLFEIGKILHRADRIVRELAATINLTICDRPFKDIIPHAILQKWTRDPFDRIITAQAIASHARLITKDTTIRSYYKRAIWD